MPFLALVIALRAAAPHKKNGSGEKWLSETPFALLEQEAKGAWLQVSLVQQLSEYPLLRITTGDNAGVIEATRLLEHLSPGTVLHVTGQQYFVQEVDVTHSDWAGVSTWEDFLAPPIGRFFQFHFGTPLVLQTSLSTPGISFFPVPALFFGKLAQRWQALGGPTFPINEVRFTTWLQDGGCVVANYRLQGRPIVLSPECRSLGFLGHITYRCREEAPVEQHMLTALARFSFFAGSGLSTDQGLGATQVAVDP